MNKWVKRFFYLLASLLGFLLLIIILLQTTWAKNLIRNKLQAYIATKTNTKFTISAIDYSLPNWVELNEVLMLDQRSDTLLYGNKIKADVAMLKLISGKYEVNKILLDNMYINLDKKANDTVFNYQFIINAFTSTSDKASSSDTSMIDLSIHQLTLQNVRFNMLDDATGSYTRIKFKDFTLDINNLDINTMTFDIKKIYADELSFGLLLKKQLRNKNTAKTSNSVIIDTSKTATGTAIPFLKADSIIVKNSYISYEDNDNAIKSINNIGLLQAAKLSNEENVNIFKGEFIQLSNGDILFDQAFVASPAVTQKNITQPDTLQVTDNLAFIIQEIDLDNNKVTYNNNATPLQVNGFDYNHIAITDMHLKAINNKFINGMVETSLQLFSFKDKSGFQLDSLNGYVKFDSDNISIKHLLLRTPTSVIRADAAIYPLTLTSSSLTESSPQNSILLTNTIISQKDIRLLSGNLADKYKKQLAEAGDFIINADINGTSKKLNIRNLDVQPVNGKYFALKLSGTASDITDIKRAGYNLNINNLTISKKLVHPFVNSNSNTIQIPPVLMLFGSVAGNMNNIFANLSLNSAFGKATVRGSIANFQNPDKLKYDMLVNATGLETGKWIYQDTVLGKLTGIIKAKGSNGFNIKTNFLNADADIQSFSWQRKTINDIKLKASLNKGSADIIASVNDKLLQVSLQGNADLAKKYPSVQGIINLSKADLLALGYSTDSLTISTLAKIDVNNANPDNLDARIMLDSIFIKRTGSNIFADSLLLTGFTRNDSTIITLNSPMADANVASDLNYLQIPDMVNEVISYYIPPKNKSLSAKATQGSIGANINLHSNDAYSALLKDINFKNVNANIFLTNTTKDSAVYANFKADELSTTTNKLSKLNITVNGTGDSLSLAMLADTVKSGSILFYHGKINAGYADNIVSVAVETSDEKKVKQYAVALSAAQNKLNNGYDIHLKDTLMLDHQAWQVNEQNIIRVASKQINLQNFDINNKNEKISLNSSTTAMNAPIAIDIDNFNLSTLTSIFNKDSTQLEGLLNADFTISDLSQTIPSANGTLKLDSIIYKKQPVGNISMNANSNNGNVTIEGKLDGNGNNTDLTGIYNDKNLDIAINLHPVAMATIQSFTSGNLTGSKGNVSGTVLINGPVGKPEWNGDLTFNGVETVSAQFGTFLKIDNQKVLLQYPDIKFNNFTIKDSIGNLLKIDGDITQDADNNLITDLTVNTNNFTAVNNSPADNPAIYGKVIVSAEAIIKGTATAPDLTGNVVVKNGTSITYVQANIAESIREREGVIEFIDMDTVYSLLTKKTLQDVQQEQTKRTVSSGILKYNVNLEMEKEAEFVIIIDPVTGDELHVKGAGNINASVNPNGSISLAGVYNLAEGSYQLNYGPVKRKFLLLSGSTIRLSGNPENANLDIIAAYEINTPPIDLISNEIGGSTSALSVPYKRKVPFQVLLKIKGTALKPILSFDIIIKEKAEGVSYELSNTIENKLQQLRADASQMNKQVFALLTLNRFIGDQSSNFFGGVGNTSLLANESVSAFLNAAIEQIADELIKGVDVDINLKNIDNPDGDGQKTNLDVALGKTFLNDRVSVTVGKNFSLTGTDPSAKGNSNVQFMPDVNTTYKLSKDGRYMLRAYRRNQYEAVLDGYFIETGAAFTLTMDYNKVKEIFGKPKK